MEGKFLKLRTFVIVAVIAIFALSIHPLTPRDFYETFRKTLKNADDPVAAGLVEDARKLQQQRPDLNQAVALLEAAANAKVDLVPLVEDAIDDFRELAAERRIELLFTVSRRSVLVWVDIERMESVVYNLLSNALKFTPNGGRIEAILSLREEEECVLLTVRDTGIGIAPEDRERIFERFVKLDTFTQGTGLGLSICKSVAEQLGGRVGVDSAVGRGSCFRLDVPVRK